MKINYKRRPDRNFVLTTSDEAKTIYTSKFLKREYSYILQSMKHENYKIEYNEFDLIQEILDGDKVVGIISFIHLEGLNHVLCINDVYILPEFRKKGLFYQTLINLLSQPNMTITMRNPNRRMIDLLIDYNLAKKLDNNLVISYINFHVNYSKRYTNKQFKDIYHRFEKDNQQELLTTDIYDLNINSCAFFDMENLIQFNENPIFIEIARKSDINDRYYQNLRMIDLTYLNVLIERYLSKDDELEEFYNNIQNRINENLDINYILGTDEKLTDIFKELLEKNNLTVDDGFSIREKVLSALKKNEIVPKSIVMRTLYLIEHFSQKEKVISNYELGFDLEERCPYCNTLNYNTQEVCKECGYNIQLKNHFIDNFPEIITDNYFLHQLIPECIIKEELNINADKLEKILKEDLEYLHYDVEDVYNSHCRIATYQLLKELEEVIYFDVFDYDSLNSIREGSAYKYAKENGLIEELKDYKLYFEMMEVCYSVKELRDILKRNNLNCEGNRDDLIYRIETLLTPLEIFGKKYLLTHEGMKYLKENKYMEFYRKNLTNFTFYEFENFYHTHKSMNFNLLKKEFIKYMEEIAIENEDYYKYQSVTLQHLEDIDDTDSEEYLVLFTQLFVIELNIWFNAKKHVKGDKPLDVNIVLEYPKIKDKFRNHDKDMIFDKALDKIKLDKLRNNVHASELYFYKSLEYEDIEDINREIEHFTHEENELKSYCIPY